MKSVVVVLVICALWAEVSVSRLSAPPGDVAGDLSGRGGAQRRVLREGKYKVAEKAPPPPTQSPTKVEVPLHPAEHPKDVKPTPPREPSASQTVSGKKPAGGGKPIPTGSASRSQSAAPIKRRRPTPTAHLKGLDPTKLVHVNADGEGIEDGEDNPQERERAQREAQRIREESARKEAAYKAPSASLNPTPLHPNIDEADDPEGVYQSDPDDHIVGHEPHIKLHPEETEDEHKRRGYAKEEHESEEMFEERIKRYKEASASLPTDPHHPKYGKGTLEEEHETEPPFEVIEYETLYKWMKTKWDAGRPGNPIGYPPHNPRLADVLYNVTHHHVVILGYGSKTCEDCLPHAGLAPNKSYVEIFNEVAGIVAAEEAHTKAAQRDFVYWRLDVDRAPRAFKDLQHLHPHHHISVPFVAVVDPRGVLATGDHAVAMPHLRTRHFRSDLLHFLNRLQHHRHAAPLQTEKELMHALFEGHSDGVTIVIFHDPSTIRSIGRGVDALDRAMREEHVHVQFLTVRFSDLKEGTPTEGYDPSRPKPPKRDISWIKKYNPNDADVVAFMVLENQPNEFVTEEFSFPEDLHEGNIAEMHRYDGYHQFRDFIDAMKGHRHIKHGRRWHGVRHKRIYGPSLTDPSIRAHHPTASPHFDCRRVRSGDVILATVVAECTGYELVFLNHTLPVAIPIMIDADEAKELAQFKTLDPPPTLIDLPPQLEPHLLGLCIERHHEIYLPPSETKGHHGEVYHVHLIRLLADRNQSSVSRSLDAENGDIQLSSGLTPSQAIPVEEKDNESDTEEGGARGGAGLAGGSRNPKGGPSLVVGDGVTDRDDL